MVASSLAIIPAPALPTMAGTSESGEIVHLSTLNWPPYTTPEMNDDGAASAVVSNVFKRAGIEAKVHFWPWKRAIAKAKSGDQQIAAYFPGYNCRHDPNADFIRSRSIGRSPIGFAEHVEAPQTWSDYDSLRHLRIGYVVGYATVPSLDAWLATHNLRMITSSDDSSNLYKLLEKQVDYAIVDKYVMAYLLQSDPKLQARRHELRFDEHVLGTNSLYVCFRDDARGRRLRDTFNRALKGFDSRTMLDSYLRRMSRG